MSEKLITVIVPVYNTEKYLDDCIMSLLNQTYRNLEIILVNDGSIDNSGTICERYANSDKRITVVHKQNEGVTLARKTGLTVAKGDFITFVDSDDWVDIDMCYALYSLMEEYDVDIVTSTYYLDGTTPINHLMPKQGRYSSFDDNLNILYENLFLDGSNGVVIGLCGKLFKNQKLKKFFDIPSFVTYGEDSIITYPYILNCDSVYILNKAFYHYRRNDKSVSYRNIPHYYKQVDCIISLLNDCVSKNKYKDILQPGLRKLLKAYVLHGFSASLDIKPKYFYLFPYELVKTSSKIIIYGAGAVGKSYVEQIRSSNYCEIVLWVDKKMAHGENGVEPLTSLRTVSDYDYVLISVSKESMFWEIRKQLEEIGVDCEKILWKKPLALLGIN